MFQYHCLNPISPVGLGKFPGKYENTEELAQEHGIHDEDPDADFTLDTLEEAADAAGELHSEWDFETEDSEGTDSGEESGTDQNTENSENGSSESENTDPGINEQ